MGEGGVDVFVSCGGKFEWADSTNEYSKLSSDGCRSRDSVSDDSDVGNDEVDELLIRDLVTLGVIVSVRGRDTKRPYARGCDFQASVDRCLGV